MKHIVRMVIIFFVFVGIIYSLMNKKDSENQAEEQFEAEIEEQEELPTEATEKFIYQWLQNDNGTIATYIQRDGKLDEDKVQGREALAETLGLVMYYALDKNDQTLFDEAYKQLTDYFLEEDGFINWKLNEDGTSEVSANALIDDIRILYSLTLADEKWDDKQYMDTAILISDYLNEHNNKEGIYTNFYDQKYSYTSADIKLSYIDIDGLETMVNQGLLDEKAVDETAQVLKEAPLSHGFYPLTYNVEEAEYEFSEDVNIIDQAILVYHYAQVGHKSEEFLAFLEEEMNNRGLINGMYDLETKKPTVDYESPAIYGFLILYALEIEEDKLAQDIYQRLKEYKITDKESEYYGGYSITNDNTHIFDNLIPLLAEQAMEK